MATNITDTLTDPIALHLVCAGGNQIDIPLRSEDGREYAVLTISGVRYHLERMRKDELVANYKTDSDPDYDPQPDQNGYCCMLIPFSEGR